MPIYLQNFTMRPHIHIYYSLRNINECYYCPLIIFVPNLPYEQNFKYEKLQSYIIERMFERTKIWNKNMEQTKRCEIIVVQLSLS